MFQAQILAMLLQHRTSCDETLTLSTLFDASDEMIQSPVRGCTTIPEGASTVASARGPAVVKSEPLPKIVETLQEDVFCMHVVSLSHLVMESNIGL